MTQKKDTKVDNAFVISQYYGFEGLELPHVEKDDHDRAQKIKNYKDFDRPSSQNRRGCCVTSTFKQ